MPRCTVMIDGTPQGPIRGIHRFVRGNPPRLVCLIRQFRCERCRTPFLIWMADDAEWRRLPRRWWKSILCVSCWRELTQDRPLRRKVSPALMDALAALMKVK